MNKPELLVTATSLQDIEKLVSAGADAFFIGEARYGLRLAGQFNRKELAQALELVRKHEKKLYVAVNAIFHNDMLEDLKDYLIYLKELEVDGIVYGDPAVLMLAKEFAENIPLHWNPEQTATNWFTCNYWGQKGASRAILAREINLDSIVEIAEKAQVETEVQVHGMTTIFHSKRTLVNNYINYHGKDYKVEESANSQQFYIYDPERDAQYPIFEDLNGTNIMSANDICLIEDLEELIDSGVTSFKINGLFKSQEYLVEVTKIYRQAIDLHLKDPEQYEDKKYDFYEAIEIIQSENRPLDTGFLYKETVY